MRTTVQSSVAGSTGLSSTPCPTKEGRRRARMACRRGTRALSEIVRPHYVVGVLCESWAKGAKGPGHKTPVGHSVQECVYVETAAGLPLVAGLPLIVRRVPLAPKGTNAESCSRFPRRTAPDCHSSPQRNGEQAGRPIHLLPATHPKPPP
ncbi:uncharacterized protein B0I36DRAFT_153319 [Microdochium trichocladiopsis]|uniref:Uncharacterized protein n=1 Tax=Microdochium trichocladiopsis TaxID=1682393 RepID=A0A9P8XYJ7_9PEZI|nr:uncharacterized protein B0I36DRAFT_153319 [Microdochium trichocladiopsis]KAH7026055.1 hypothetical protein B0I36DRAFT_153319 [Microdochium trichocladiopsis]